MPGKPGSLGSKTIKVWSDCRRISIRTQNISCVVIREYVEQIRLLVPGIGRTRSQQGTRRDPGYTGNQLSSIEQRDASFMISPTPANLSFQCLQKQCAAVVLAL